MDIDDILREVDPVADSIPSETRDLQALTRAWVAERCAPELLECATTSKTPRNTLLLSVELRLIQFLIRPTGGQPTASSSASTTA